MDGYNVMDRAEGSDRYVKLPIQSVERGLRFGCGYARYMIRGYQLPFQLLGTPEGEAADRYTKVDNRSHTKSQVRPVLQSPRNFPEGEVAKGCLRPLGNRESDVLCKGRARQMSC